jgi:hypothetical protein
MFFMDFSEAFRSLRDSGPAGWAICAVVAAQVAVPAVALLDEPPTRFGFQMYSAMGEVTVEAVDARGEPVDVAPETLVAGTLRPDADWTGVLPERVCDAVPEASSVTVTQPDNRRTVTCD